MNAELKAAVERAHRVAIDEYGRHGGSLHQRVIRALADEPEVVIALQDDLAMLQRLMPLSSIIRILRRLAEIVK